MPYISNDGQVLESRSPWRLSVIPEMIWGLINFIVLFFQTLINPSKNSKGDRYTSEYRRPGGGGPGGGGPRRRMGGVGGRGGAPGPPPMAGGG
ncbi:selenoprotein K [Aplysia californica]|uniref:Selenoprotein K n=1 Tax=Aplysia californica TaxID=6500 RepID=A0ABM0JZZ0_APLCA|nr:selenoprotein K [Aplysia californica]